MDIVFVGAGRLATNMACALRQKGHEIKAVFSQTLDHSEALCSVVGGVAADDVGQLPLEADAFVIAVKDTAIAEVLPKLAEGRAGQAFFHTSGSVPMSVFGTHGCHGVIYPMQTFSLGQQVDFSHVPFFIEGNSESALRIADEIAGSLSTHIEQRSSEERRTLHLAAVFACNFVNHCYALSAEVLEEGGMDFSVMLPLIEETANKVHTMHPREAQTGPAVRYDRSVIDAHLKMLEHEQMIHDVYQLMSQSISVLSSKP